MVKKVLIESVPSSSCYFNFLASEQWTITINKYLSQIKLKMCPKFHTAFHRSQFGCWYKHQQPICIPTWLTREKPRYLFQSETFSILLTNAAVRQPTGVLWDQARSSRLAPQQQQRHKCLCVYEPLWQCFPRCGGSQRVGDEFTSPINPDSSRSRFCSQKGTRKIKTHRCAYV